MTIKEHVNTDEKINNYIEQGKLTIGLADELEDDFDIEHERVNLIKTMRKVIEHNYEVERKLHNLINLLDNLQNQVDSIEIDNKNIV